MTKAFLYVRVSTDEQRKHGLSVDNQIKALTEYCAKNGIEIYDIYNDAGRSAHASYKKRKELLRLIDDSQKKCASIILFTKLDRWFRSIEDYYEVMSQIPDTIPWQAIWEDYETVTSAGRFKVNIMLSIAQAEAERTSERIKATMAYKKERGDYVGSAPIGYIVKGRDLLKDEQHKIAMEKFFEKLLSTTSIASAVEEASAYGLNLSMNHMRKLVKNPVYYGECKNGYKCEPYITKDQYDEIMRFRSQRTRAPKINNRIFLFSGITFCGYCGHNMSAKAVMRTHANGDVVTHKKYHCQYDRNMNYKCPHCQMSEPMIENFLLAELDKMIEDRKIFVKEQNSRADMKSGMKKKLDLESKLKRLANLYADGDISLEDYRLKRDAIKSEISSIIIEPIKEPQALPDEWKEIYNDLDELHKKAFWKKIIKSITITNENKQHPDVEFL